MGPRNMEMAVMLVLGLLVMSMHVSSNNIHVGLITNSYYAEKALNESGAFVISSYTDLHGIRFVTGTIYGNPVVYCRTSTTPVLRAGTTLQLMADNYNLIGVIHFGSVGAVNHSLTIGTVSVPLHVRYTGSFSWEKEGRNDQGQLVFGDYNLPQNGQNSMGSLKFDESHSYYAYPKWFRYASNVQIDTGDVILGMNSSSSDIYVKNFEYGKFLYKTFGVSTVDKASGVLGLAAKWTGMRYISFQGISNKVGGSSTTIEDAILASTNVVKAVINFIWQATYTDVFANDA